MQTAFSNIVRHQIPGEYLCIIASHFRQPVGGVLGGVGIHDYIVGLIGVNIVFEACTVRAVLDKVTAVIGVEETIPQVFALNGAKHQVVIEGENGIEHLIGDLSCGQVTRGAKLEETAT